MSLKSCIILLLAVTFVSVTCAVIWSARGSEIDQDPPHQIDYSDHEVIQRSPASVAVSRTNADGFPIPSVILAGATNGIGNQLFKYAFGYTLSRQLNASLFLKFKRPDKRKFSAGERIFVLDQFKLDETKFTHLGQDAELPSRYDTVHVNEVDYFENRIPNDKIILLDDFWVSEKFFKPYAAEIVAQYEMNIDLSDTSIYRQIQETESVAVHCRVGDFNGKTPGNNRVLPFSYHLRAMELVKTMTPKELTFFIFSDDINYVKMEMRMHKKEFGRRIVFVSNANTTSIEEFYLMRSCKHTIVPNSTFSWWAAYLNSNPNKIIIAPYPRNRPEFYERYKNPDTKKYKKMLSEKFSYPKGWITLNPFIDEAQASS